MMVRHEREWRMSRLIQKHWLVCNLPATDCLVCAFVHASIERLWQARSTIADAARALARMQ
jgi:hypothetical protein